MTFDNNLQESEAEIKFSDKDIFTNIWSSPRLVFKYINDFNYEKHVTFLLILAGITNALDRASTKSMGDDMSLIAVLTFCILLGGILGWISFYIYAALLSWTGKWLNAKGNTNSLLRMSAHAMIPSIVALLLLIPQIAIFGNGIFQSELDVNEGGILSMLVFYITILMELILGLWTLVIFVIGISEFQKLSIGKSILNMILPGLLILVPIIIIAFIIKGLS